MARADMAVTPTKGVDTNPTTLHLTSTPYVLPNAPSVLTVGYCCMEEGFDFIWRAYQRPFFRDSKNNKTYMDVRDCVPYLKSWKEGTAVPAQRKPEPPISASYVQDSQGPSDDKGSEVATEEDSEIIRDEMSVEPLGSKVCCEEEASAAEAGALTR